MEGFRGFPEGKMALTSIPDLFFSELLPIVDDLFELKVTLHCLWLIQQKSGEVRYTTDTELREDEILMRGLGDIDLSPEEALQEGLERAVARGTLLEVVAQSPGQREERLYLVNGARGREVVKKIESGEWTLPGRGDQVHLRARRPNIFNLYEQNLGLIQSPILADELTDAERTYPPDWIEDAFRIAVANNARRWAYVRSILERWQREGRGQKQDSDSREARRSYVEGEYGDQIKH